MSTAPPPPDLTSEERELLTSALAKAGGALPAPARVLLERSRTPETWLQLATGLVAGDSGEAAAALGRVALLLAARQHLFERELLEDARTLLLQVVRWEPVQARLLLRALRDWLAESGQELGWLQGQGAARWAMLQELVGIAVVLDPEERDILATFLEGGEPRRCSTDLASHWRGLPFQGAAHRDRLLRSAPLLALWAPTPEACQPPAGAPAPPPEAWPRQADHSTSRQKVEKAWVVRMLALFGLLPVLLFAPILLEHLPTGGQIEAWVRAPSAAHQAAGLLTLACGEQRPTSWSTQDCAMARALLPAPAAHECPAARATLGSLRAGPHAHSQIVRLLTSAVDDTCGPTPPTEPP
ncbi:MAG: hypothetical protein ABIO70_31515 [Pseudomonadota bacterium]